MEFVPKFLWKKDEKNRDLYCDIFEDIGHLQTFSNVKLEIDALFQMRKERKSEELAQVSSRNGQNLYENKKCKEAMQKYNYAIQYADGKGEELSVALILRAKCFFILGMFTKCLIDIDLAMKNNYPKYLLPNIRETKAKCKLYIDQRSQDKYISFKAWEPELKFTEHREFGGVADCLKLQKNEQYGNHVITMCDLKIGQIILNEEPYATMQKDVNVGRIRCAHCYKECMNYIPCKNCIFALFCDENCIKKSFHKYQCNASKIMPEQSFDLVIRTFFQMVEDFPDIDFLMNTIELLLKGKKPPRLQTAAQKNFVALFSIVTHHEKMSYAKFRRFLEATRVANIIITRNTDFKRKFKTMKQKRFLNQIIFHLFHLGEHAIELYEFSYECISRRMIEYCERTFAKGFYPFACNINHSCLPNVYCYSIDNRLICKTIRPIKKGEQIFTSYIRGSIRTCEQKTQHLNDRYSMKCDCLICKEDMWTLKPLLKKVDPLYDPLFTFVTKPFMLEAHKFLSMQPNDIKRYEQVAIALLDKYDDLHPCAGTISLQEILFTLWNFFSHPSEQCYILFDIQP